MLEGADYYRMTTLKEAHAAWKRRVRHFERSLSQIKAAYTNGAIADMVHGEQQLNEVNIKWNDFEDAYATFEINYPEPENLAPEQPKDAQVCQERIELYDRAHNAQVTFRLEANRVLADLRRTAAPVVRKLTSAQRVNAIKARRKGIKYLRS